MDQTMLTLNQAKSHGVTGGKMAYNNEYSPLRKSISPVRDTAQKRGGYQVQTETMPRRKLNVDLGGTCTPNKEQRKRSQNSALRTKGQHYEPVMMSYGRSTAPTAASGLSELLGQVELLQKERDMYANDAHAEKAKNSDLEGEFHVLRGLIKEAQKPVGSEENIMLRS